jgi:enamine deaminase RidA (YjgF/YER057c/UK114 family)
MSRANETVVKIRQLKDQINERLSKVTGKPVGQGFSLADKKLKPGDQKIVTAGQSLLAKLTDIEGEIYQYRNQSSQDPLNYPIKLNNKLAALAGVVGSTDARPTDSSYQVYQVYKELSSRLEAQLSTLETIIKTDIEAFYK